MTRNKLTLDTRSGVPLYVQLREQLIAFIGAGGVASGERMPTMRDLAAELRIDLNTVQRAYAELERRGFIETRRGRGTFVAQAPPPVDLAQRGLKTRALAEQTVAIARLQGIDPAEVAEAIMRLSRSGNTQGEPS